VQALEARFLLNFLLPQIRNETATTRKVLAAVPADKGDYRPHPASKSALELAWHLASSDYWFLESILRGQFSAEEGGMPSQLRSPADVAAWYENNVPPLVDRLSDLSDEQLLREVPFFGLMSWPAVGYLLLAIVHGVHHRGQLSAYLRPMGGKVPSIYGGSADEPLQPPA